MKYNATVVQIDGDNAIVRYKLKENCGGWSARKLSPEERLREVSAANDIGAKTGDAVVLYMPNAVDLFLSAKEQALPMIVGFIAMIAFNMLFGDSLMALNKYVSGIAQISVFFVVLSLSKTLFKKYAFKNTTSKKQQIRIVEYAPQCESPKVALNAIKID